MRLICCYILAAGMAVMGGCQSGNDSESYVLEGFTLTQVAQSQRQWTGVAVSDDGRIFVNFPRWNDTLAFSVGELSPDGTVTPYPNEMWNTWNPGLDPASRFVCVQSVFVDDSDYLWVLDPASPRFEGVVAGGPKLVKIDLVTDSVVRVYSFDSTVALPQSYLNDVRIDSPRQKAYISESGLGAIIVLDLQTGQSRRRLDEHPSTKAEHITVTVDGKEWLRPDGSRPSVNCDGIALHPTGEWVYYQVLTGYKLHRIKVEDLLNDSLDVLERASKVEYIDSTGVADGIMFDTDGNLYLTALEHNAINRYTVDGVIETVAQDRRIYWPDSFARGAGGRIYFTTSQIPAGLNPPGPYRLFVLEPKS